MDEPKVHFTIDSETGFTLGELKAECERLGLSDDVIIDYAGCGSHQIEIRDAVEFDAGQRELRRERATS